MLVKMKNRDWIVPEYKTPWACAFDFSSSETVIFNPGEFKLIDTGTVIETPEWYCLLTAPRSSTFKNFWLMQVNSVWIIDTDYCWAKDTIKFPFMNMTKDLVTINAWERIGRWMFVAIWKADFKRVNIISNVDRWWFWTTVIK
jgi:dUTP pyrophosphatase